MLSLEVQCRSALISVSYCISRVRIRQDQPERFCEHRPRDRGVVVILSPCVAMCRHLSPRESRFYVGSGTNLCTTINGRFWSFVVVFGQRD